MGGHRSASLLLGLVVGAGLLAGCGQASSPLATSATTTPTTTPPVASTTTSTVATTTTTSTSTTTVPSTTTTSLPARAKRSAVLPFSASYAHFSADFPYAPTKSSVPESVGSFHLRVYVAVAKGAKGPAEVAEEDISPDLPSAGADAAMTAALKAITTTSSLKLKGQPTATTYRSYAGYSASYTLLGVDMRGLTFMADNYSRLYIIVAPTKIFTPFSASLKLTK